MVDLAVAVWDLMWLLITFVVMFVVLVSAMTTIIINKIIDEVIEWIKICCKKWKRRETTTPRVQEKIRTQVFVVMFRKIKI